MQATTEKQHHARKFDSGAINAHRTLAVDSHIDRMTLARLDLGLFRALRKLGTPKQRICSALCLSYAEYDEILKLI